MTGLHVPLGLKVLANVFLLLQCINMYCIHDLAVIGGAAPLTSHS